MNRSEFIDLLIKDSYVLKIYSNPSDEEIVSTLPFKLNLIYKMYNCNYNYHYEYDFNKEEMVKLLYDLDYLDNRCLKDMLI